jgi:SnoaL-like domain
MPQLTLEERVDRLESIDAIKRLKAVYCMYCDAKYDAGGICSLFTVDGVWDGGLSFGCYQGHDQIRNFFEGISGDIVFAAHLVLNPIITVHENQARGRWWLHMPCTAINNAGTAEGRWLLSEYDEEYVRIDGEWKFKKLRLDVKYYVPHLQDWAAASIKDQNL